MGPETVLCQQQGIHYDGSKLWAWHTWYFQAPIQHPTIRDGFSVFSVPTYYFFSVRHSLRCMQVEAGAWFLEIDTKVLRWENYIKAGYSS